MAKAACSTRKAIGRAMSTGAMIALGAILMSYSLLPVPSDAAPVKFDRGCLNNEAGVCVAAADGNCSPPTKPSSIPLVPHVFMDKPLYRPGEVARFRIWAFDAVDNSLARMNARRCTWKILDPSDTVILSRSSLPIDGTEYDGWRIPEHAKGGQYTLTAECGGMPKALHIFHVRAFRNPEISVSVDFLNDSYGAGDTVTAIVDVARADGSPLSSGSVLSGSAKVELMAGFDTMVEIPRKGVSSGTAIVTFNVTEQQITGDGTLHLVVEDGGIFEAVVVPIPLVGSAISIEFTPEGRKNLLTGVDNIVFFAASDRAGNAVDFEGTVFETCGGLDSQPLSTTIHSEHEGRGKFSLPAKSSCSYYVEVINPSSVSGRFPLPPAEAGATISLVSEPSQLVAGGTVTAMAVVSNPTEKDLELKLFRKGLRLASGTANAFTPVELELPAGIFGVMRLSLYVNGEEEAERLVFVRPSASAPLQLNVTMGKDLYSPGEEASLTVTATDSEGKPVKAIVSVTVTDESGWQLTPVGKRPTRLPERILLSDEVSEDLGASVRVPSFYSEEVPDAYERLDLLLGTQQWRKLAFKEPYEFMDALDDTDKAKRMLGIPPQIILTGGNMMMMKFGGEGMARGLQFDGQASFASVSLSDGLAVESAGAPSPTQEEPLFDSPLLDRNSRQLALQNSIPEQASPFAHLGPSEDLSGGERFDWTQTVYWSSAQETDENGELPISFKVSHSMTTMRVMVDAVLVEDCTEPNCHLDTIAEASTPAASFGVSDAFFSIREPLYVEPKLPHHLVVGDRAFIPLSINNRGDTRLSPLVALSHIDVGLDAPDAQRNLAIPGAVESGESTRLLLNVLASDRAPLDFHDGIHASVSITVNDAESFTDSVSRMLHILPDGIPVTTEASGTFPASSAGRVPISLEEAKVAFADGDIVEGSIAGELKVYPSPLESLMEAVVALLRRPCGCFEQTSSSHFPNIMIADFMQSMRLHEGEHAAFFAKTLAHLKEGYDRLVSYETSEDGFEWFGSSPPHEALTAYGLLEFSAMKRVEGVDVSEALLSRTKELLLSLREGDGFHKNPKALDSFGRAPRDVTTAYIVWAMSQSNVGADLLEQQVNGLISSVRGDVQQARANPYVLALLTDSLYNFGMTSIAEEFGDYLMAAFDSDGNLVSQEDHPTITMSRGTSLEVEIASLASLAMMNDPQRYMSRIHVCMKQVLSRCKNGAFGSTQATVLGLRSIIAYWKLVGSANSDCQTTIMVGSTPAAQFSAAEEVPALGPFITAALQGGEDLSLASECENLMYSTSVQWRRKSVPESDLPEFSFSTAIEQEGELKESDSLFVNINWCNQGSEASAMLLASVGVPGGVDVDTEFLDLAVSKGEVDFYELASDSSELYLYWRGSQAGQCAGLRLPAVATVPGRYSSVASHFYQYYDDEHQIWQEPLRVAIAAIQ